MLLCCLLHRCLAVTFTFEQQLRGKLTFDKSFDHSSEVSISLGIPYLDETTLGSIAFTDSFNWTDGDEHTTTKTANMVYTLNEPLPPLTLQQATATAGVAVMSFKVCANKSVNDSRL